MPFPNPTDPELRERMRYLDAQPPPSPAAAPLATIPSDRAGDLCTAPPGAGQAGAGIGSGPRLGLTGAAAAAPLAAASAPAPGPAGCAGRVQAASQVVHADASAARLAPACGAGRPAGPAGREYYEDLCMKAVNQCVGRVIRHAGDWAAILLVDVRWAGRTRSRNPTMNPSPGPDSDGGGGGSGRAWECPLAKLPGWIQQSVAVTPTFGDAYARLHGFARAMSSA